ncbi:ABC transporter substrate-binding protein [Metabacillus arenae]|uniref:Sugar ABC transporter substrate-binding protein n=1 Tax=Metabacillus arenae TaxID=2771434 RepID=A0A926RYR4_9BACI|nr:sugar ABC transporter substrate-binding protein [Metabacillus arenae]MBD1382040.1 sugar ABC transporter substrate-binding protein [Metabacillus arenae]
MKYANFSKNLLLGVTMIFMIILTAGCSSDAETGGENGKTKIKVWLLPFIEPEEFESLVSEFNASHHSVEVELTMLGWSDGREQIKTAITSGTGPDVFYLGSLDEEYTQANVLVPAEVLGFSQKEIETFNPLIEGYKENGQIMAFPLGYEMNMLFYRKDILSKYGFEGPPATWDELYHTAKTISEATMDNGKPGVMGLQINGMDEHRNAMNLSWGSMFAAAGGQYIKDGESVLNSPEGQEALSFMKRFYEENLAIPGLSAVNGFANGEVAMFYFTQPTADQQDWYNDSNMADKWGMAPMPKGPESAAGHFGGHGVAVNSRSDKIEAAGEFVRWLASPERTRVFMESAHYISPFNLEKVDSEVKAEIEEFTSKQPEVWEALNQQLDNNINADSAELFIQSRQGYTERWAAQPSHLIPAITGETSIEESLENIDVQVNHAINY